MSILRIAVRLARLVTWPARLLRSGYWMRLWLASTEQQAKLIERLRDLEAEADHNGRNALRRPAVIAPAKTLNRFLTAVEVAGLAGVGVDTVRKAVYLTRAGEAKPGSTWFLPRKNSMRAGFDVGDALRWLEARGQLPAEYQGALHQLG